MTETLEKWPRQYAAHVLRGRTRDERQKRLGRVPEHLQGLARAHVETTWGRRRATTGGET